MFSIDIPLKDEFPVLMEIWESSVRATHDFLKEKDIDRIKSVILENDLFSQVTLYCIRDTSRTIIGFCGISGESLEMLFIRPDYLQMGCGKTLLLYVINQYHITSVDVNEQNTDAVRFYEYFGFRPTGRSELDGSGKPYPIIHMKLIQI